MRSLAGKTLFITGASRGIGLAIALRAARDGANIVVAAKTTTPHPKLPGTIYTAVEEIEAAGGQALAVAVDIRDEGQVQTAVAGSTGGPGFGGGPGFAGGPSGTGTDTGTVDLKRYDFILQFSWRPTTPGSKLPPPPMTAGMEPVAQ